MKRKISFLMAAVMAVSMFTGCQKSSDPNAVTEKPLDNKMEAAQTASTGSSFEDQLNLPNRFTGEWTGLDGCFHVTADADIALPALDAIPTATVTRKPFSQEDADKLLNYFIQNNTLYRSLGTNKQEAQARLEKYYAVQRGEIPITDVTTDHTIDELPDLIAHWEAYVKTAPENSEVEVSRDFQRHDFCDEWIYGYAYVGDKTVHVRIENDADLSDAAYFYVAGYGDPSSSNIDAYYIDEMTEDERSGITVQMDENKAKQIGDFLMKDLGIENVVCDVSRPVVYFNAGNETGYALEYVRQVNGFPISRCDIYDFTADGRTLIYNGGEGASYPANDPARNGLWAYEKITVYVAEEGVVYFRWRNPYSVPVIQTENTQLMSFQDISDIFAKMIFVKNHFWLEANEENGFVLNHNVNVDRVELNLMRIRDKNNYSEGTLIPVWDFWAKTSVSPEDESKRNYVDTSAYYEVVLTINAIDGTVIERELGY